MSKPRPKPAAKRAKPMVVWVPIYKLLDNFPSAVFRTKRGADRWVRECYDQTPYRVVRFVESQRKGK